MQAYYLANNPHLAGGGLTIETTNLPSENALADNPMDNPLFQNHKSTYYIDAQLRP